MLGKTSIHKSARGLDVIQAQTAENIAGAV